MITITIHTDGAAEVVAGTTSGGRYSMAQIADAMYRGIAGGQLLSQSPTTYSFRGAIDGQNFTTVVTGTGLTVQGFQAGNVIVTGGIIETITTRLETGTGLLDYLEVTGLSIDGAEAGKAAQDLIDTQETDNPAVNFIGGRDLILNLPDIDILHQDFQHDRFGYPIILDGNDRITLGSEDGWLDAGPGNDVVFGGSDNNTIRGGDGSDTLYGRASRDWLMGEDGNDRLFGGAGGDSFQGGNGADHLFGGAGADDLDGNNGADRISGGRGQDDLGGGDKNDVLYGGGGSDDVFGGSGADVLFGGDGNDFMTGAVGKDTLYGGAGRDVLQGNQSSDILRGGKGGDHLTGGIGSDVLTGGRGADVFRFYRLDLGTDTVTDYEIGQDEIDVDRLEDVAFSAHDDGLMMETGISGRVLLLGIFDEADVTYY